MNDVPLWRARAASLSMAGAWAIVSFAAGINAVVKSNREKEMVRALAPPNSTVHVNDNDVFQTGAIITAVSLVIFLTTYGSLAFLIYRPTSFTRPKLITAQASILALFTAWLFATLVPYTHFFRTRSARIDATLGTFQIPEAIIQRIQQENGLTPVYMQIGYLRLLAILPWIEFFFSLVATMILFMAASRMESHRPLPPPVRSGTPPIMEEKEKVDSPPIA
ncbi:hypothetical protein AGABI1DRAFT_116389 [Agaricus bisporus var. burnettii JB137-S8]|uniref:Uncharacterized protein n=1 Tax=Agaricus bisporus var. burnettii (strain JB137-S8 / ATCC MYA-4627 / FGSC 10392) TaxID=597362 RepID=K5XLP8_AGABU|nr:uncharacterized protein AGABI1DRAFT_116389 [Agaricus bisporus var. burnettii JB137-S8]EKM75465.1 hypothetical protein AGABI1DRAFT_116389 [Agaricus bisporus var. burnettii JB137-S8]